LEELPDKRMMTFGPIFGDPLGFHHLKIKQLIGHRVVHPIFRWLWKSAAQKKQKVFFWVFLRYTIRPVRPVEKWLVCNRKGLICKDPAVEINSIRRYTHTSVF
jgi:hypothetical protein